MSEDNLQEQLEISTEYQYKLKIRNNEECFEGPLELLLELVKKAKIDIKDIFLTDITDQFLSYTNDLKDLSLDCACEFILLATTLLEIKVKSLLPNNEAEVEELKNEFISRVEEYTLLKEASQKLKDKEVVGQLYKNPDNSAFKPNYILKDMNIDGLMQAFTKLLSKIEKNQNPKNTHKEIKKDIFTVRQKIDYIKEIVVKNREVNFFDLFTQDTTKVEIITTFQALLELLKLQIICAEQNDIFDDIIIKIKQGAELHMNEEIILDEEEQNG